MNHKIAFTFAPFKPEGYDELKEKGCEVFMPCLLYTSPSPRD